MQKTEMPPEVVYLGISKKVARRGSFPFVAIPEEDVLRWAKERNCPMPVHPGWVLVAEVWEIDEESMTAVKRRRECRDRGAYFDIVGEAQDAHFLWERWSNDAEELPGPSWGQMPPACAAPAATGNA